MAEQTLRKTPRDILRLVFRCKWLFLLGASVFAIVAMLVAQHVMPVSYSAETKFQRRSDLASTGSKSGPAFEEDKLTLTYDLKGRHAIALVAEELKLLQGLSHDADGKLTREGQMARNAIISKLAAGVSITWNVRSTTLDLVTVKVTNPDAKLAQRLPDAIVRNYINRISERIIARLAYSQTFLGNQVRECGVRLRELEAAQLKFEVKHARMMPNNPGALDRQIQLAQANMRRLKTRRETVELTLSRLKAIRPTTRPTSRPATQPATEKVNIPNPEMARLQGEFRNLEEVLRAELFQKTEKHPTIITLRDKMRLLAHRISQTPPEVTVDKNTVINAPEVDEPKDDIALAAHIATANSELETVTREIEEQEQSLIPLLDLMKNFAVVRQGYQDLCGKVSAESKELNTWQKRYNTLQMDLEAEVAKRRTHLSAVQAAEEQERPSSPSLMMLLALPILGGLGFGGALVFLANLLDRSVTTVEHATQRFHVPVHGIISEIVSGPRRFSRALKNWVLLPSVMFVLLVALALSSMSAVLWLRYPQQHKRWKNTPVEFVLDSASDLLNGLGLD